MLISDFGLRIKDDEIKQIVANHLIGEGYKVLVEDVGIVQLTSGKIEMVIRHFQKN